MSRKDPSITTSITLQMCDDSIIIKDASGKTRIASCDDEKKIAKIINEIVKDSSLPPIDFLNVKVTNEGAEVIGNETGFENIDFTDFESMKKQGLNQGLNFLFKTIQQSGNFKRGKMGK